MCGRYTLATPVERLAEQFGFDDSSVEIPPNYNVAPTQGVAAVLEEDGRRRLEVLRWGLIPPWADDPQIGSRMINARSETAPGKPSFRRAFRERRARIVGYYFESEVRRCVGRNRRRLGKERVPDVAIFATAKKLVAPSYSEGFDELLRVHIADDDSTFEVRPYADEADSWT